MHLFAIDGLRIALISRNARRAAARAASLARMVRFDCDPRNLVLRRRNRLGIVRDSRSSVMMTIVLGGWALKRPGDLLNSLATAAFIILLCEPLQIF